MLTDRIRVSLAGLLLAGSGPGAAGTTIVSDVEGLRSAVAAANPGDEIILASGTYTVNGALDITRNGTPAAPIRMRAQSPHSAALHSDTVEAIRINASDWRIDGLVMQGICAVDDDCEHAFHILSRADRLLLSNNRCFDFNAPIKGNGEPIGPGGAYVFADDVVIENSFIYATRPRQTASPVTFVDIVGGQRWIVRGNLIYDFEKAQGNQISYGAFLKGNSSDGLFERNLVICARNFSGGFRLGLSFGGGGTGAQFCEGGDCTTEHRNGRMRNNLILNCSDVGIYLNRAQNTTIDHNTLYATTGIDVRFTASSATLRNNVLSDAIRNRDGGTSTSNGNLTQVDDASMQAWFVNPAAGDFRLSDGSALINRGVASTGVLDDFCGDDRDDGNNDLGAIEYDGELDCVTVLDQTERVFRDGFE